MTMLNEKLRKLIPYSAIPVIMLAFWLVQKSNMTPWGLVNYEIVIAFGYYVAWNDFKNKTITNTTVLIMLACWIVMTVFHLFFDTQTALDVLASSGLGGLVAGGLFLLVYFISRKGVGGGDVKYMTVAGLYLGYGAVLPTMLIGSVLAAIVGLVLIILKRMGKTDTMPLAPFLYAGMLITIFLL